jgi:hypothetical protein
MTTEWAVTTGAERVALDSTGNADLIFTVTNNSAVNDRAVLDVVVEPPTDRSWFVVEEPQRLIPPSASVPFRVRVTVPPGAPPGSHYVKALVYSADTAPEESARYSNRIAFDVKAAEQPTKKIPWWIFVVIAAVVLALVVGVVLFFVLSDDGPPPTGNGQGTPTPAGPDLTNRQIAGARSDVIAAGGNATATATCPAGTVVIGGGHFLRQPVGTVIDSSRPAPAGQGWQVHGFNPTAANVDFDVVVVCGVVPGREVINQSASVNPGGATTVTATCPSGTVSIGGGASALGLVIDTSRPAQSGQGWQARAVNTTGAARTVSAHAICASAVSREVASTTFTVPAGSRNEDIVDCPSGKVSTGGGFVFSPPNGLSLFLSDPSSSEGWDVRAENTSGANRTVNAFAVCLTEG